MKVTAALSRSAESPFTLEEVELDGPRPDEVLVKIHATGLCHTDLTFKAQVPIPAVLGHEGAGVVEAVGDEVTHIRPGDYVVLSYRSCGECRQCGAGERAYCSRAARLNLSGTRLDGSSTLSQNGNGLFGSFFGQSSFAQYALAAADNTVVVDASTDLATAAPLGCGLQTGAGAVLNVLTPEPDSRLVVFGAGGVGLAAVMAAKAIGVHTIIAVDPVASRRDKAVALGATRTVDPTTEDVSSVARGATHALDTTANTDVIATALGLLRQRGVLVLVGLGASRGTIDLTDLMFGGKVIRGCIEGDANPQEFIPELLRMHAEGRFPIESLISRYPARAIDQAVADARSGAAIKPVLLW
ncbi:NAD(P)-dependent alcohol dehydrogenase [Mycobacteroides salmoniphilum]|uniref:Aryl-alcohol dehydrogenase n=1 Tax=Mycobacteroides salmoniphilum TaxID=404941 RepID=A0A4R8SWC8_9MYCO|nr:NAD(P)-dependent alcohol dehydrogenase [Mycobacteroides salmoniphilum]TDZ98968.1 Aryl-alcohol dehydrogenase [Mycobacteroides salmoniphilum]TEA06325.1 Aryl-alcohol dehydrogenase [Mycobacteroides salmoniphilum]